MDCPSPSTSLERSGPHSETDPLQTDDRYPDEGAVISSNGDFEKKSEEAGSTESGVSRIAAAYVNEGISRPRLIAFALPSIVTFDEDTEVR